MAKKMLVFLNLVVLASLLAGCSALQPQATPTPEIEEEEDVQPLVNATGVVVPRDYSTLSMAAGGNIAELLVSENEAVSAGQPLVRLEGQESLQAAAAAARLEVAAAQYALDQLYKDLDVRAAQAAQAVVEARIEARDAERYLRNLRLGAEQIDIDQARANVAIARKTMEDAQEDFEEYERKPEDNPVRAAFLSKKAQAEKDYENAARLLNNLLSGANDLDTAEAIARLDLANAQLAFSERELTIIQAGPDPEEVKLAEERLANAQAQLVAAEAALADLELTAPFAGVVSERYVRPAQFLVPGQPVLLLADLAHLRVETTDLNEIDVARLDIGDAAMISFDALPGVVVAGKVERIAPKAAQGSGVNYTVVILLDEIPARLLWGMTAFVDIAVSE